MRGGGRGGAASGGPVNSRPVGAGSLRELRLSLAAAILDDNVQAVVIRQRDSQGVLELAEVSEPAPQNREIRIRVRATAVNRADVLQRRGLYPAPQGAPPDICGLEYSGEVEALGPEVTRWRPGDRVMGLLAGGGYAEKVLTHEELAVPVPSGLSWEAAAAIPEVFSTAYDALELQLKLRAGETVLIHAAASGVGTAAIQLAKTMGARVFATSSTPDKLELARQLGADLAISYREDDFAEVVSRETGGAGVQAILDLVGASHWPGNLRSLAPLGRMILVGLVGGSRVEADLGVILRKRLRVYGTVLRTRSLDEKIELTRCFARDVLPLLADGRIRPVVDRVYALDEAGEAHRWMESNRSAGKIVLKVP